MRIKKLPSPTTKPQRSIIKSIPFLFIIGTCMHFIYDWSNHNFIIELISPVNKSVWEHMKLVILPLICWWIFYYIRNSHKFNIDKNKWFTSGFSSLIVSIASMPFIFYFYTQAFGVELLIVDIIILLICLILGQLLALHLYKHSDGINYKAGISIFLVIIVLFMTCTYYPAEIPIFKDGKTGEYGIEK